MDASFWESLEKYGAGRSVVLDRQDRVIAGNKTVEAACVAGMKSVAVIESDGALAVCEDDAGIYVWHASQRQIEVEKAMQDCGILVHQQII